MKKKKYKTLADLSQDYNIEVIKLTAIDTKNNKTMCVLYDKERDGEFDNHIEKIDNKTCFNCKHLFFSDCYGECNKQLKIVSPNDSYSMYEKKVKKTNS